MKIKEDGGLDRAEFITAMAALLVDYEQEMAMEDMATTAVKRNGSGGDWVSAQRKNDSGKEIVGEGKSSWKKPKNSVLLRPVICICNDLYAPALRPLRQVAKCLALSACTTLVSVEPKLTIETRNHVLKATLGFFGLPDDPSDVINGLIHNLITLLRAILVTRDTNPEVRKTSVQCSIPLSLPRSANFSFGLDIELCYSALSAVEDVITILRNLVLLIRVTKVAKSAFDKALAEHEDIDDAVGSEEPIERSTTFITIWMDNEYVIIRLHHKGRFTKNTYLGGLHETLGEDPHRFSYSVLMEFVKEMKYKEIGGINVINNGWKLVSLTKTRSLATKLPDSSEKKKAAASATSFSVESA
ncbi:hypothetical protein OROMI_017094 [Orobanche minor]